MEHSEEGRRANNNLSTLQMFSVQPVLPEYSSQDRNINLELPDYCDDEPPPPYSERNKVQSELPVTRPPRYNLPNRSPLETSLHPVNDKPFVFNKDFATSKFAVFKLVEFVSHHYCLIYARPIHNFYFDVRNIILNIKCEIFQTKSYLLMRNF